MNSPIHQLILKNKKKNPINLRTLSDSNNEYLRSRIQMRLERTDKVKNLISKAIIENPKMTKIDNPKPKRSSISRRRSSSGKLDDLAKLKDNGKLDAGSFQNVFEKSFDHFLEHNSRKLQKKFGEEDNISEEFENEQMEEEDSYEFQQEFDPKIESIEDDESSDNTNSAYEHNSKPSAKIEHQQRISKLLLGDKFAEMVGRNLKRTLKRKIRKRVIQKSNVQNLKIDRYSQINKFFEKGQKLVRKDDGIKQLLINEDSSFTIFWNLFLTFILGFQILLFPYENFSEPWLEFDLTQIIMNLICEQMFIIDIFLNFFTSQRDRYGHVVKIPSVIVVSQLRGWFFIDLISSIPSTNLMQFNILKGENYNVQLKLLKLPKYLRVFRGVINVFGSRVSNTISLDKQISFSNSELSRYANTVKYGVSFLVISNILVCYLITYTDICVDQRQCENWFQTLMEGEQRKALSDHEHHLQGVAVGFRKEQESEEEQQMHFQNWALERRTLLQINAWYFVIQTVTTVGYGDVSTNDTDERIFRCICMVIGVILFTLVSSSVLETTISDTLNIQRNNKHEVMIEKLTAKYEMNGDSKRFLSLLGDALYTEKLNNEVEFTQLLPKQMCESVLKTIWRIYYNKFPLLHDESMSFFIKMMKVSSFRRCIQDEGIEQNEKKISIIYSGTIGCHVANLKEYMQQDYLHYMDIGEELGYQNFIKLNSNASTNYDYLCVTNADLVEVKTSDYLKLILESLKGLDQVRHKVTGQLVELQLMVSLQQSMQKMGQQIHQQWQQSMMSILHFDAHDKQVCDRLFQTFTKYKQTHGFKYSGMLQGKWYQHILTNDIYRYVLHKVDLIEDDIIDTHSFPQLQRNTKPINGKVSQNATINLEKNPLYHYNIANYDARENIEV